MGCNKKLSIIGVTFLSFLVSASTLWASGGSPSGFISVDTDFIPHEEVAGSKRWIKPGLDFASYNKILIEPIEIWVAPDSKYKGLEADESKKIADTMRYVVTQELEPDYPVVGQAGSGVIAMRVAITNVRMKKKKRGLLGYTPVGFAVTTAANIAGLRTVLDQATIEAEMYDGETFERVGAMMHPLGSSKKDKLSWEKLIEQFEIYSKLLKKRLTSK